MPTSASTRKKPSKPSAISTVIPLPKNPAQPALQKAVALQQAGKLAEAVQSYDEVLKHAPKKLAAIVNKGVALRRLGKHEAAMASFWRALAIQPENIEALNGAANTLLDMQRYDEGEEVLKACIAKAPHIPEVWVSLSRLLLTRKQYPAAEAVLGRAIALRPSLDIRLERATLWLEQGKLAESLAEYLDLQKLMPKEALTYTGAGQALIGLHRFEEALPHLHRGIELNPDHLDGQLGLARWHLLQGEFAKGWEQYEWRLKRWTIKPAEFEGPDWDGSDPKGKTILVYAEQGFGDTIQFLRYLPLLAARGAKIIVFCQKAMLPLVQQMECVAYASNIRQSTPDYDFHVPIMSLPHRMKLSNEPIPCTVPYIKTSKQAQLPIPPLGTKLRVGLVWAGSATHPDDHNRSIGLSRLLAIAGVPGVKVYSLQVGPRAEDISQMAHPALVEDFSKHLKSFADTAAVINQLDLVIAVDTAVAHLAGALGKPVWTVVPMVPDWRWQMGRTDSPWYPTMRVYRQEEKGDWKKTMNRLIGDLAAVASTAPLKIAEPEKIEANSVFVNTEGQPRFRLTAPREFLNDPGIGFLMQRERAGVGYEYATRTFLDAHLKSDDLFLDIGAHWGIMSLQAATRWSKEENNVRVLAFEPSTRNVTHLKHWIDENGAGENIDIIEAAVSDTDGQGELRPESTMGHSLQRSEKGSISVVTVDAEVAKRPKLKNRRIIAKIDVEGHEPEVIAGMKNLLANKKVGIVIWERGIEYDTPEGQKRLETLCEKFKNMGFTLWRFESEDRAGKLLRFKEDGRNGNIIAFAPGLKPEKSYGEKRPVPVNQPSDPHYDISERARFLMRKGTHIFAESKAKQALTFYAEAAALDSRMKDLYNNLGVMLKDTMPAARTVCYQRAHRLAPNDAGIASNLANAFREEGRFEEAAGLNNRVFEVANSNMNFVYNAALLHRDSGAPQTALEMFDKVLEKQPDHHDCRWDRALVLLQMGDYAKGMPAYESRWNIDRAKKRSTPLKRWDGSPLKGQSIFLHDEQGFGDVIQFARFIPELKKKYGAGKVVLECQPELMRLMVNTPGVDAVIPREKFIPQCDVYTPLLSLPGLFGTTLSTLPAQVPYLFPPEMAQETRDALPSDDRLKVGLVWAGQLIPKDRSCPLEKILPLLNDSRIAPISLQVGSRSGDLKKFGADAFITDMSPYLRDFAETAAVLSELDLMITIDTSVAHLAGALGIPTYLLLLHTSDWRWFDDIAHSPWYPSFKVFRQIQPRRWSEPLVELNKALKDFCE